MKFNSKVLGILLALLAISMVISAVGAVDLVKNDFNGNFSVDIPSDSFFGEDTTTQMKFGNISMDLMCFENTGNNSSDIHHIFYFKDSSANKTMIGDFIKDLERDGKKIEEKDNYVVLESGNSNASDSDIAGNIGSALGFAQNLLSSSNGNMSISADGNKVSLSDKGLEVSDANGQNVSINSDGVNVSGNESDDFNLTSEDLNDLNLTSENSTDFDFNTNLNDCKYVLYMKNKANDQVIVLAGNNLDVLKSMAKTASFSEN